MFHRIVLLVAAAIAGGVHAATPDRVSSKLTIHVPHSLAKEGGYDHREALFGRPPYGGSIAQTVYYIDNDLCDSNKPVTNVWPSDAGSGKDGHPLLKPPFILMVDRGTCAFVQKVRNAQHLGAAGVIIADNTCLCSDQDCMAHQQSGGNIQPACETAEPVMADDGSGADVSVPSFLMFKHDADAVKAELKLNRPVQIEMTWSLPNPDDRVEYDLFSAPTDPVTYHFWKEWPPIAKALGSKAYFTPHMYIFDGERSQCHGANGENKCFNLCSNNGRYCAMDPDKNLEEGVSGFDVVKESLRRACIWSNYGELDGIGEVYWNYVNEFLDRCANKDYFNNEDCVRDCYQRAGVDGPNIERCMDNSGGLAKDSTNSFLDAEIKSQSEYGVVIMPTAFVNNVAIRGSMTVSNIFQAVCAGYAQGTRPEICTMCMQCGDAATCVKNKGVCPAGSGGSSYGGAAKGTVSKHTFFGWMFFVVAAFTGVGVWHYKKTREDMREQVRTILADYMPLTDNDEGVGSGGGGGGMQMQMPFGNGGMPSFMGGGGGSGGGASGMSTDYRSPGAI